MVADSGATLNFHGFLEALFCSEMSSSRMLNSSQLLPMFHCNSRCSEDSFIALCSNKSPLYIMAFLYTVQGFGFSERCGGGLHACRMWNRVTVYLLTGVSRQRRDLILKGRMPSEDSERLDEPLADGRLTLNGLLNLKGRNQCRAVVCTVRNI